MTNFNVDSQTDELLEELRQKLGASSKADVLRKSIAFLKEAADRQEDDGTVILKGKKPQSSSNTNPRSPEITILLKQ